MKLVAFVLTGAVLPFAFITAYGASLPAAPSAPNILILYVDNIGYGDLGAYGNHEVKTPRIDQLAREGARCTDFYVVTSSCTPSRFRVRRRARTVSRRNGSFP